MKILKKVRSDHFFPTSGLKPFEPEDAGIELGKLLKIQSCESYVI